MKHWNVLVIGLGSIGRRHVRILNETIHCNIFVLRQKTKRPEDIPGVKEYLYRWEDFERKTFDFAVICNPTSHHIPAAIALAERNIPFLMEKPVCGSFEQASRLTRLVKNKKLPVLVGFNTRHHYLYKKIKDIIASRQLGKVLSFFSETGQYLPDWRASDYTKSSSARKELGGGVIFDLTHEMDFAVDLLGDVRNMTCLKARLSSLNINTEDIAEITMAHKNGGIAHIHLDYLQEAFTRKFKLIFEKGEIFWNYASGTLELTTKNKRRVYKQPKDYTRDDTFKTQLKHWLRVIKGLEKPLVPLERGLYISKLAMAAHASSEQKKWIRIN